VATGGTISAVGNASAPRPALVGSGASAPRSGASAALNASMLGQRSAGTSAIARPMIAASAGSTPSSATGVVDACLASSTVATLPTNAGRPTTISYSTRPSA
jgi:hypothetical protein